MSKHFRILMASAMTFSLALPGFVIAPAAAQTAPSAEAPGDSGWQKEFEHWRAASKSGKKADYSAYLKAYPRGKFANVAKQRLDALNGVVVEKKPVETQTTDKKTTEAETPPAEIEDSVAAESDPADTDAANATEDAAATEKLAPASEVQTEDAAAEDSADPAIAEGDKPATTDQASNDGGKDIELWRTVSKTGKQADYERYLKAFPTGKFAKVAKTRIANLIAKADTPDGNKPETDTAAVEEDQTKPADQADATASQSDDTAAAADQTTDNQTADNQTTDDQAADSQTAGSQLDVAPSNEDDTQKADATEGQTDDVQQQDANTAAGADKPAPGGWAQEYALWKAASDGHTVAEYEAYLKAYPNGKFAAIAQARVVQLAAAETPSADVTEGDDQLDASKTEDDAVAGKQDSVKPNQKISKLDPAQTDEDNGGQVAGQKKRLTLTEGSQETEDALFSRKTRQEIQGRLSSLGYNTRGTDGDFGDKSREAISAWQTDNKAPVNGFLSGDQAGLIKKQSKSSYKNWLKQQVAASPRVKQKRQKLDIDVVGPDDDVVIIERIQ